MTKETTGRNRSTVLIIDDEMAVGAFVARLVEEDGIRTERMTSAESGLSRLREESGVDAVIVDLHMPNMDGFTFLEKAHDLRPDLPIIVMTAQGSVEAAVQAMKKGAFDFLAKPFEPPDVVIAACRRAIAHSRLFRQNLELKEQLKKPVERSLVGSTPPMKKLRQMIDAVAPTDATVLIVGETGTGKELVSRAIHDRSNRKGGAFLPINCGALSESLLESELFGHVRGAFTGATNARRGMFEAASGGTLFLDEVGELSLSTQTRLLRVLQEGEVRPVGSDSSRGVDVRVVAATHRDLEQAVAKGTFREDLYYRLNVFRLSIPPLRDRVADIPALTAHFVEKLSRKLGRVPPIVDDEAVQWLSQLPWRGNLRQLENSIERALILAQDRVTVDLFETVTNWTTPREGLVPESRAEEVQPLRTARLAFERRYLERLLASVGGSRADAARRAHLDPSNLRRLLKRHHLE